MSRTINPCPLPTSKNGKHVWRHYHDETVTSGTVSARGASIKMSRKGVYRCDCTAWKYGPAKSGL